MRDSKTRFTYLFCPCHLVLKNFFPFLQVILFKNSVKQRLASAAPGVRWETEAHLRSSILSEWCPHIPHSMPNEPGCLAECERNRLQLNEDKRSDWGAPGKASKAGEPDAERGQEQRHGPEAAASVQTDAHLLRLGKAGRPSRGHQPERQPLCLLWWDELMLGRFSNIWLLVKCVFTSCPFLY